MNCGCCIDYIYPFESKTSGTSISLTENGVSHGDQVTTYLWGAKEAVKKLGLDPNDVCGVQPDISYWNTKAKKESNIQHIRPDLVYRSPENLIGSHLFVNRQLHSINQLFLVRD